MNAPSTLANPELMARRQFVLLVGPPGAGKTAWAREFSKRQLLFAETEPDAARIYRLAGLDSAATRGPEGDGLRFQHTFRAPHHSVSEAGMTGCLTRGWCPQPGELSLAHGGTLFLDDLPEFRASVLDRVLGAVRLGYVEHATQYTRVLLPACFSLVASMNPCPCGYHGCPQGYRGPVCRCSDEQIARYRKRVEKFEKLGIVVLLPGKVEP